MRLASNFKELCRTRVDLVSDVLDHFTHNLCFKESLGALGQFQYPGLRRDNGADSEALGVSSACIGCTVP